MLEVPSVTPLPFLWRPLIEKGIDAGIRRIMREMDCAYVVSKKGLTRWNGMGAVTDATFRVPSCTFGGDSTTHLHPSMTLLVGTLRKLGARPRFLQNDDGPAFSFLFDISSDHRAVYELATANHGQEIVSLVFCELLSDAVVRNVRLIDQALYTIIEECKVPALQ